VLGHGDSMHMYFLTILITTSVDIQDHAQGKTYIGNFCPMWENLAFSCGTVTEIHWKYFASRKSMQIYSFIIIVIIFNHVR
jgi:hypothetical protein